MSFIFEEDLKMDHAANLIAPRFTVALLFSLILLAASTGAIAQQPAGNPSEDRDRGIQLYQQGDFHGAVKLLRSAANKGKTDLSAWHWLGLALERQGKSGDARKAHEKAARLGDDLLTNQLAQANTGKEVAQVLGSVHSQLVEAAESAEKYLALNSKLSGSKLTEWRLRADSLRGFADMASSDSDGLKLFSGKDVTTKARILSKPEPTYTEEARRHKTTGTVVLKAIFAANGRVIGIHPVTYLPHGLTERSVAAAQQIKFIPAIKDGHPVSMYMQLEYNFNLY
jgi:tetratricopeptide (TPR) repeat protein